MVGLGRKTDKTLNPRISLGGGMPEEAGNREMRRKKKKRVGCGCGCTTARDFNSLDQHCYFYFYFLFLPNLGGRNSFTKFY